jgi:hypothetical protein
MRFHNGPLHGDPVPDNLKTLRGYTLIIDGVRYDYEPNDALGDEDVNSKEFWTLISAKLAIPSEPNRRAFYDRKQHSKRGKGGRFG